MLLLFLGAGPATSISTAADAFQADAFQTDALAFQTSPAAAPTTPPVGDGQGAGVKTIQPSRRKLKRLLEEAEVALAAESGVIALEGDGWTDEEVLEILLLELV